MLQQRRGSVTIPELSRREDVTEALGSCMMDFLDPFLKGFLPVFFFFFKYFVSLKKSNSMCFLRSADGFGAGSDDSWAQVKIPDSCKGWVTGRLENESFSGGFMLYPMGGFFGRLFGMFLEFFVSNWVIFGMLFGRSNGFWEGFLAGGWMKATTRVVLFLLRGIFGVASKGF